MAIIKNPIVIVNGSNDSSIIITINSSYTAWTSTKTWAEIVAAAMAGEPICLSYIVDDTQHRTFAVYFGDVEEGAGEDTGITFFTVLSPDGWGENFAVWGWNIWDDGSVTRASQHPIGAGTASVKLSTTDPGEGATLAANTLYGVHE